MPRPPPAPAPEPGRGRTAVLLIHLGTPDAPAAPAVRRYLRGLLADPRLVELPPLLWRPILYGIVSNLRARRSAQRYASIWTPEGSPLAVHTARQASLLRGRLNADGRALRVEVATRHGRPAIGEVLTRLMLEGCARILLLPMTPQYSAGATASAFDAAFGWAAAARDVPELRAVRGFACDPGYIAALAASVRRHWARHGRPAKSGRLLMSFHGIPEKAVERGDPYREECLATARALARALELGDEEYAIAFQSRFGAGRWLRPYTAATLETLARQGIERVDVLCPGFPADCLETLEEIAVTGKSVFLQAGGREYHALPCLNEDDEWIDALAGIVRRHLQGWVSES